MSEQARLDIMNVINQIQADFSDYPLVVESDNRQVVDEATQDNPYLQVEIDYLPGGGQMDLGTRPMVKQVGQLCLYAVVKEGAGSAGAGHLLDFVLPYFDCKTRGIVTFHAGQRVRPIRRNGKWYAPVWFDFWFVRYT
jgi:hypothetical protein